MRFKITWSSNPFSGGYKVSIPNYEGGEVVTIDEHEEITSKLRAEYEAKIAERDNAAWALERVIRAVERRRAIQIMSQNKGNPGAAMAEILGEVK